MLIVRPSPLQGPYLRGQMGRKERGFPSGLPVIVQALECLHRPGLGILAFSDREQGQGRAGGLNAGRCLPVVDCLHDGLQTMRECLSSLSSSHRPLCITAGSQNRMNRDTDSNPFPVVRGGQQKRPVARPSFFPAFSLLTLHTI